MPPTIPRENIQLLKQFIQLCDAQPELLQLPELDFFRQWLAKLGATIPNVKGHAHSESTKMDTDDEVHRTSSKQNDEPFKTKSESESDLEIDTTGVIEGDHDPPQPMGDPDAEITEAMCEQSDEKRTKALSKLANGEFEDAINLLTEAIENNPQSAALFAKRAQCYVKIQKPNAAIRDCNRALEINENSSQALKWRGKAHRMLGHWEDAYKDFCKAQASDFDEDVQKWCKEVEANAKKVAEHKRKYERRREEREVESKRERVRKAQEAYAKAQKDESERRAQEQQSRSSGTRQHPGAGVRPDLGAFMNDPEILQAMQDPDVQRAFSEINADPSKIAQYQNNPKVRRVMDRLASKVGGAQFPGAGPGARSANDLD